MPGVAGDEAATVEPGVGVVRRPHLEGQPGYRLVVTVLQGNFQLGRLEGAPLLEETALEIDALTDADVGDGPTEGSRCV